MCHRGRTVRVLVLTGLVGSALMLALAPLGLPAGYSWLSHTTSQSAAQGVSGAWVARVGFVLFGVSVLVLTVARRRAWGPAAVPHGIFGLCMVAVAVFSSQSWAPEAAYDRSEDLLHSVAATALGFAFALGVVATLLREQPPGRRRRWPRDAVAVLASVAVPLAMTALPDFDGALQRLIFLVAYGWYGTEAVNGVRRAEGRAP